MAASGAKYVARILLLIVVALILGGVFVYVQNMPPRLDEIEQAIDAGELWGQPREAADALFRDEPTSVALEETDSPSTERWLYDVHAKPGVFYLIRVQNGVISQAQRADQQGTVLKTGEAAQ